MREQKLLVCRRGFRGRRLGRLRRATRARLCGRGDGNDDTNDRGERSESHTSKLFHKNAKVSYIPHMALDPELLEILACPNCKTPVTLVKNGAALKCAVCKRVYAIKDDIPVMLIDEATIEN